jgi:cytochrome P450
MKESLRRNPPVWLNARTLTEPLELNGYEVPARTLVAMAHLHMMNDPRFVTQPDVFNPERWIKTHDR